MPWRGMRPMDLRLQLVAEYLDGVGSMTELCEQYGVSRKTGYKWVARYEADGPPGLSDRPRRPHHLARAMDAGVRAAVLTARQRHPSWGARKLLAWLARHAPAQAWPTRSSVCDLLRREGLIRVRRRRARPGAPVPVRPVRHANEVWTVDYKGQFLTGDGQLCYPLTLRDAWSRYVLRCDALAGPLLGPTWERLARAFAEYGLPERIRSDNGPPFAGAGLARLSQLAVWWMRLGITPERIAPAHPEQNGSHEQFHAVLKRETTRPPAATRAAQQRRFTRFCREYNEERPHEALHDRPPATCYTPSRRRLPDRLPPLEYPGHWQVRRVSPIGQISWGGALVFVSGTLAGTDVALEEVDDGLWTLYFGGTPLGRFDERTRAIRPLRST
jgi:putative transposase